MHLSDQDMVKDLSTPELKYAKYAILMIDCLGKKLIVVENDILSKLS